MNNNNPITKYPEGLYYLEKNMGRRPVRWISRMCRWFSIHNGSIRSLGS